MEIKITTEYIKLDQLLKFSGAVVTGSFAVKRAFSMRRPEKSGYEVYLRVIVSDITAVRGKAKANIADAARNDTVTRQSIIFLIIR